MIFDYIVNTQRIRGLQKQYIANIYSGLQFKYNAQKHIAIITSFTMTLSHSQLSAVKYSGEPKVTMNYKFEKNNTNKYSRYDEINWFSTVTDSLHSTKK